MIKLFRYIQPLALSILALLFVTTNITAQHLPHFFDTQAHRGGRGLMPENTISAIIDAMNRGVVTLEMDLQLTKDEKIVVAHDSWFNEKITTTPDGNELTRKEARKLLLSELTYDRTRQHGVGLKPNPDYTGKKNVSSNIPLLSELLKATEKQGESLCKMPRYNIEIKTHNEMNDWDIDNKRGFLDKVMEIEKCFPIESRLTIQSFDIEMLFLINRNYPDIPISYLVNFKNKKEISELIEEFGFIPDVYSPDYRPVTPKLIHYCHKRGIKIITWSVNETDTMKKLKQMGVDGAISDYSVVFQNL